MDNLGSHKSAALRRMIKVAGARLWYLPPYSPDKQAFTKVKHWMRALQKRTVEDAWRHPETALSAASKIKDYSDGARKPELRRTAWWSW
jgi:transposase